MAKLLVVRLSAVGSSKALLERDITLNSLDELKEFPFHSVIDGLDVLYKTVPHDIEFVLSDMSTLDNM